MCKEIEFARVTKFFLGYCKQCNATARIEPTKEVRNGIRYVLPNGQRATHSYLSKHGVMFARFFATCLCSKFVEFRQVVAWPSKKECNATCMTAKGNSCDCKCAGKNHGAGFQSGSAA